MTAEIKSFFDIVGNVNTSYELIAKEAIQSVGNIFMMNRAMSNNFDTVFFADEGNGFKNVDVYSQYLFYFYSVNKKKRYGKWEKKSDTTDDLKLVMDSYSVSAKRAMEYLDVLTSDQLNSLRESQNRGGKDGKIRKNK